MSVGVHFRTEECMFVCRNAVCTGDFTFLSGVPMYSYPGSGVMLVISMHILATLFAFGVGQNA